MATTRDLIQRMARELDLYRQLLRDDCTSTHPLADEARAYLAQPKPEGPTVMEIIALADEIEAEDLGQVDLVRRAIARWGRLAQPEPEGLTDEEIEKRFQRWWFDEGSGMRPSNYEDQEEYVCRVSQIAWNNGAHAARWGRPVTTQEANGQT